VRSELKLLVGELLAELRLEPGLSQPIGWNIPPLDGGDMGLAVELGDLTNKAIVPVVLEDQRLGAIRSPFIGFRHCRARGSGVPWDLSRCIGRDPGSLCRASRTLCPVVHQRFGPLLVPELLDRRHFADLLDVETQRGWRPRLRD
jgi:hypothetical protein